MKNKWSIILIVVLLVLTSAFLSACTAKDELEEQAPTQGAVSDEPLENNVDYAEDDEMTDDESSEEVLDGHEEETVIDENIGEIPEEKPEF